MITLSKSGCYLFKTMKTELTEENLPFRFGIPFPETSKELNWPNETWWAWEINSMSKKWHVSLYYKTAVPAPQVHEIAELLPKSFYWNESIHYLNLVTMDDNTQRLRYTTEGHTTDFEVPVNGNHLAQAYAEMYLKLKEEGICEK